MLENDSLVLETVCDEGLGVAASQCCKGMCVLSHESSVPGKIRRVLQNNTNRSVTLFDSISQERGSQSDLDNLINTIR